VDVKEIEERNQEVWRIPELLLPLYKVKGQDASVVIEVDPAYMADED
jgi:hypothetical protein